MTLLLDEAFRRARLLDEHEQDAIAALVLDELEDQLQWEMSFSATAGALRELAQRAINEHRNGETDTLTFD